MEVIKRNARDIPYRYTGKMEFYIGSGEDEKLYTTEYFVEGRHHRLDGPAIIYCAGWYKEGEMVEFWYLHGRNYQDKEEFFNTAIQIAITDEEKNAILWNLDKWK